ncbi:hypothetical protein C2E23DRAFT_882892 [Lenzites betulinus]|nr:hypothetical protein C2E23DRAFT_882892 [Lenzites betulinus]
MNSATSTNFTFQYAGSAVPANAPSTHGSRQLRDHEFEKKYEEHRRAVKEVARQWPFPIKWSNALAFPPREILGPAPNEQGEEVEKRALKRRRTTKRTEGDDADASFLPAERVVVETPSPPPEPAAPMSAKARGKRPAPAEDEKTGDHEEAGKAGGHEVAVPDGEDIIDGKLRCRWGGKCTEEWCKYDPAVVRAHLVKVHGVEKDFTCCWADNCNTAISAMATLERHVRVIHFKCEEWVCPRCKKDLSRRDALKRHMEKCKARARLRGG